MARIVFYPSKHCLNLPDGSELKQIEGIPLTFGCKRGNCGVCAIKVMEGADNLTKISPDEKKTLHKKGLFNKEDRLACQCALNGDITIHFER